MERRTPGFLLAVDLGTSAIKGAVHRIDGTLVHSVGCAYALDTPAPDIAEVLADTYWTTFQDVVGSLMRALPGEAHKVRALTLSVQGETLVPVGHDGTPTRPAIVWLDNRAGLEAQELAAKFGDDTIYQATGQPKMLPTWPAAKILWVARHEPDTFARTRKWLLLEDYFIARLTGELVCEGSLATSTCYWNFRTKTWWPDMLTAIGIDDTSLPSLVEPGTVIGRIRASVADELGLPSTTRVCMGGLDQACGAIGVGNIRPGIVSENTGTAVALCATLQAPRLDPGARMPCHYHALPEHYMFHTFTSGGLIVRWFRDTLYRGQVGSPGPDDDALYDLMDAEAALVPAGSEGITILPHLQGAMAPESNAAARGAIVGFSMFHRRAHIIRAILESITFVVRRNLEVLEDIGVPVTAVQAAGGGARSRLWKQIEADVTKRPVTVTAQPDAATLGASILAATSLGWYADIPEAVDAMVRPVQVFTPNPAQFAIYDEAYGRYRMSYEGLQPFFKGEDAEHA